MQYNVMYARSENKCTGVEKRWKKKNQKHRYTQNNVHLLVLGTQSSEWFGCCKLYIVHIMQFMSFGNISI